MIIKILNSYGFSKYIKMQSDKIIGYTQNIKNATSFNNEDVKPILDQINFINIKHKLDNKIILIQEGIDATNCV